MFVTWIVFLAASALILLALGRLLSFGIRDQRNSSVAENGPAEQEPSAEQRGDVKWVQRKGSAS